MNDLDYNSVLIGLTYLETFFNDDVENRAFILDASSPEELLKAMTVISMILTGVLSTTSPQMGDHKVIIDTVRRIALKKSD